MVTRKIFEILEAKDLLEDLINGEETFSMKAAYEMYVMWSQLEKVEDFFFKQLYSIIDEEHIKSGEMTEDEKETYEVIIESEIIIEPFRISFKEFSFETNMQLNDKDNAVFKKLFSKNGD